MAGSSPRTRWVHERVAALPAGARVLDVGFVGAYGSPTLHASLRAARPDLRWLGVDLDVDGLLEHGVPATAAGDVLHLPFADRSVDAVLFLEVLEHIYGEDRILAELRRVLTPGGTLLLTTPSSWNWVRIFRSWMRGSMASRIDPVVVRGYLGAHDHVRFFDPLSLVNTLGDHGFRTDELSTRDHRIPLLARLIPRLASVDLRVWPFDRLGGYLCLVSRRSDGPSIP